MKRKTLQIIFIMVLIVLAASPISTIGHELWHFGFSYFYGAKPVALCVGFSNIAIAMTMIDMSNVTVDKCYIHFVDNLVATTITVSIMLLVIYIFMMKYIDLFEKLKG